MTPRPRFLVTAGNTRERIDRVRDWGNVFTGNTGLAIARAVVEVGDVDLLTSNRAHLAELAGGTRHIHASGFTSHEQLRGALAALMARERYDGVFMTAAVADYSPAGVFQVVRRDADAAAGAGREVWHVRDVSAGKVKGHFEEIAVVGRRTEKLVDLFRHEWGHCGLLVKFKLEVGIGVEELIRIGQPSRAASGADYLVANTLDMLEGDKAGAYLLSEQGSEWLPRAELAPRMARLAREAVGRARP